MLTYGYRLNVINSAAHLAHTFDGTNLTIQGVGKFDSAQIICASAHRASAPVMATATVTIPAASVLDIEASAKNVSVTFYIRTKSYSYSAKHASDWIGHGKGYSFNVVVDGSDTGTIIAGKIRAQFAALKGGFVNDVYLPFTIAGTGADVVVTSEDRTLYFDNEAILRAETNYFDVRLTPVLTASSMGKGIGADLEASVRFDNARTAGQYNVSPNEVPDIHGNYSEIVFEIASPVSNNGWAHHDAMAGGITPGGVTPNTTQKFVLYYKEGTTLFDGDATVDQMIKWILGSSNVTKATVLKSDGSEVAGADAAAQADDFIA